MGSVRIKQIGPQSVLLLQCPENITHAIALTYFGIQKGDTLGIPVFQPFIRYSWTGLRRLGQIVEYVQESLAPPAKVRSNISSESLYLVGGDTEVEHDDA